MADTLVSPLLLDAEEVDNTENIRALKSVSVDALLPRKKVCVEPRNRTRSRRRRSDDILHPSIPVCLRTPMSRHVSML